MDVLMPQLGETVAEGTISAWHKSVGDRVEPGDTLFDVETDKASMDVPSTSSGVLTEIRVGSGEIALVGTVVAVIGDTLDESVVASKRPEVARPVPTQAGANTRATTVAVPVAADATAGVLPPTSGKLAARAAHRMTPSTEVFTPDRNYGPARLAGGVYTTPYARRLADELHVRLSDVRGSGPKGRIGGQDVVSHSRAGGSTTSQPQFEGRYTVRPVDGMRAAIARRMTESKQTIPHFYLTIDVNAAGLAKRRDAINADGHGGSAGAKVSMTDLLVSVWAGALKNVPAANAVWDGDKILEFSQVDIGVAVAIEGGLVTPVIRDGAGKSIGDIAREMKDLATRARSRKLKQSELTGGVSSISNLGMYGIREFSAIINPPQSTILAVGAMQRRAVEGPAGEVTFASIMTVTLACDHRVIDGVLGAKLLAAFRELADSGT